MTTALDLGCSEFRSLRHDGQKLVARRLPTVYAVIQDDSMNRRLLEQSHVAYAASEGSLVIIGDAAVELSQLISRPLVPLLREGKIGENDPIGRQVCAWIIELLLPVAEKPGELCAMTLPRGDTILRTTEGGSSKFLEHLVQLRGYQTQIMNPSTALALAELGDDEFSGASLTIGAESVTFGLMHHSQAVIETKLRKGVNEIIERYAHARKKLTWDADGNSYLDIRGVKSWLASGEISLSRPQNDDQRWLRASLEELMLSAWFGFKRTIATSHETILEKPVPLVLSGAITQIEGFSQIVLETLSLSGVPLVTQSVRTATFEPYSVARGLLIQATLASNESSKAA